MQHANWLTDYYLLLLLFRLLLKSCIGDFHFCQINFLRQDLYFESSSRDFWVAYTLQHWAFIHRTVLLSGPNAWHWKKGWGLVSVNTLYTLWDICVSFSIPSSIPSLTVSWGSCPMFGLGSRFDVLAGEAPHMWRRSELDPQTQRAGPGTDHQRTLCRQKPWSVCSGACCAAPHCWWPTCWPHTTSVPGTLSS